MSTIQAADNFGATSGALTGDTATLGGTWASMGGVSDSDDFTETAAPDNAVIRTATADGETMPEGRGVILGTATPTDVQVGVSLAHSTGVSTAGTYQGVIARFTDNDNFATAYYRAVTTGASASVTCQVHVAGVRYVLQTKDLSPYSIGTFKRLELTIHTSGAWFVSLDGTLEMSGFDSRLATGGALASGKSGFIDLQTNVTASTRTYKNFMVSIPEPAEAAMHPSRSLVWGYDGSLQREASGGTHYAYAAGQQGVGSPMLGPAGAEGLSNRLVIASDELNPDHAASGAQCPRLDYVVTHRPAYLLGRHQS